MLVIRLSIAAALSALLSFGAPARADTPYVFALPRGFPSPNIPADNPLTWEKVELGRLLFYDLKLSFNMTYSCASCHKPELAFTDGLARAVGSTQQVHPRSAMSLANIAYAGTFTWADKLTPSLEQQMLVPMFGENPIVELGLGGHEDELFARLRADARYRRMFAEAFPGDPSDGVSIRTITQALASFERTLISGNSAYDRYVFGDDDAISRSAIRGETLFFDEKRECFHCHEGFNFTTSIDYADHVPERQFHNNALYNLNCAAEGLPDLVLPQCQRPSTPGPGTPIPTPTPTCAPGNPCHRCDGDGPQAMGCYPADNTGLFARTGDTADMGRFKAPTLRNIAVTGPYMHDGSVATLADVLDHYAAGGRTLTDGPYAGSVGAASPVANRFMRGFSLTEREKGDLLAFLESLTDDEFLANPRFADPFQPVACPGDCDGNGSVTVNELVVGINISLGPSSLALCLASDPNGDGTVNIDELIRAMTRLLNACS